MDEQAGQDGAALGEHPAPQACRAGGWASLADGLPQSAQTRQRFGGQTLCNLTSPPAPKVPFPLGPGLTGFPTHLYANHRLRHRERHFVPASPAQLLLFPGRAEPLRPDTLQGLG